MYDDLKDKRVLITGGASGIGYATARRFINEGCRVIILDNDPSALKVARSELPLLAGGISRWSGWFGQLRPQCGPDRFL